MTLCFAAHALFGMLVLIEFTQFFFVLVFLRLVLTGLASSTFLRSFTTAPPDFSTPLTFVSFATPIVVLALGVVFTAALADFEILVVFTSARFQLGHSFLHFVLLLGKQSIDFLYSFEFVVCSLEFLCHFFEVFLCGEDSNSELFHGYEFLLKHFGFLLYQVLSLVQKSVTFF
jgi:hypothetical protein